LSCQAGRKTDVVAIEDRDVLSFGNLKGFVSRIAGAHVCWVAQTDYASITGGPTLDDLSRTVTGAIVYNDKFKCSQSLVKDGADRLLQKSLSVVDCHHYRHFSVHQQFLSGQKAF
jgi:hypothetical protein